MVIKRRKVRVEVELNVGEDSVEVYFDHDWWTAIWIGLRGVSCAMYDIPLWCWEKTLWLIGVRRIEQ